MQHKDTYASWLETRRKAQVPPGFTQAVMGRVADLDAQRAKAALGSKGLFDAPWMACVLRWASAAGLSALAAYRLWCVAARLLLPY